MNLYVALLQHQILIDAFAVVLIHHIVSRVCDMADDIDFYHMALTQI